LHRFFLTTKGVKVFTLKPFLRLNILSIEVHRNLKIKDFYLPQNKKSAKSARENNKISSKVRRFRRVGFYI